MKISRYSDVKQADSEGNLEKNSTRADCQVTQAKFQAFHEVPDLNHVLGSNNEGLKEVTEMKIYSEEGGSCLLVDSNSNQRQALNERRVDGVVRKLSPRQQPSMPTFISAFTILSDVAIYGKVVSGLKKTTHLGPVYFYVLKVFLKKLFFYVFCFNLIIFYVFRSF
jgi:hypothetical protein